MIGEYALEPELVATWVDRRTGRYFIEQFGLGQPRIVSRYPKNWKKLVWEAFGGGGDMERKRLEELIERLSEVMVKRRDGLWDLSCAWLENAEREHARVAFQAIIARHNPRGHPMTLIADEIDDTLPAWRAHRACTIPRTAIGMAESVAGMLRLARVVVFVDPYFGPENTRHRRPLKAFLAALVDSRPGDVPSRLEMTCSADGGGTDEFFFEECQRRLPRCIPRGLRLRLLRLRARPGGEQLHNRYILTDLGGVMFGVGLDDGPDGETDDVGLLPREQYEKRWQQYVVAPIAFDQVGEVVEVAGQ